LVTRRGLLHGLTDRMDGTALREAKCNGIAVARKLLAQQT
jgi:hypothetical protein